MNKILLGLTGPVALLAVGVLPIFAQPSEGLPNEASTALQHFLYVSSEVDEERGEALRGLLDHKVLVEPKLIELLREGPSQETLDSFLAGVDERWRQREAFLKQNSDLGLTKDVLERARSLTREQYTDLARNQFVRQHREKAAIGLAAIGSPEGRSALREVAAREDDELRDFIRPLLANAPGK